MSKLVIPLDEVTINDVSEVGGKNASLGEMLQTLTPKGIRVPNGYAITATAYRFFLENTGLKDYIKEELEGLDTRNLTQLSHKAKAIRAKIIATEFPEDLIDAIAKQHQKTEKEYGKQASFAVRSSATAEDLPDASFAGEHDTYLNISGIKNILFAVKQAMASLFTDRAISYRVDKGFDHFSIALSVGVQKMVRSDLACSGVMFTLDTETGFSGVVLINGSWGLGEMIVQGHVTPDEFMVSKAQLGIKRKTGFFTKKEYVPIIEKKLGTKMQKMIYSGSVGTRIVETSIYERENLVLSDKEVLELAKWGVRIEEHYSKLKNKWVPMDTEWAKDGQSGKLFIVQARPETVQVGKDRGVIETYFLNEKGTVLVKGASVGSKIATGKARVILDPKDIKNFKTGEVLVTEMTDPDWEPIMKIAAAIVTDKGGRTSHAAIVSRELGIPAIVGCIDASKKIHTGASVTVDTTGQEGVVYKGELRFGIRRENVKDLPKLKTHILLNIATPDTAFEKSFLPNDGVGLAREEFIIASNIGIHPMALINYPRIPEFFKKAIDKKTAGYKDKKSYYVDNLAFGIAKIATAFYPKPVIVRFSDFKTNEYRSLIGGELYEPQEENPMIGWRGASRYYSPDFKPAFVLELQAIKRVRDEMGLTNVKVMVPFCRTIEEGKKVLKILADNKLTKKHSPGLEVYVMCEIPENVILANDFLDIFDGMSIGSNDLTQLTLGIDRDGNEKIKMISNENNPAVKELISQVVEICLKRKKYIGICGQAPSDYPDFAKMLVKLGIESISLNPDSVIKTILEIAKAEES